MGLTNRSTGTNAVDSGLYIQRQHAEDKIIALAGNPNVGKSTTRFFPLLIIRTMLSASTTLPLLLPETVMF